MCAEVRPQRSAADVRRELEAREESRNTVKLIWRALASMASGQPNTLCNSALFWPRVSSRQYSSSETRRVSCLLRHKTSLLSAIQTPPESKTAFQTHLQPDALPVISPVCAEVAVHATYVYCSMCQKVHSTVITYWYQTRLRHLCRFQRNLLLMCCACIHHAREDPASHCQACPLIVHSVTPALWLPIAPKPVGMLYQKGI